MGGLQLGARFQPHNKTEERARRAAQGLAAIGVGAGNVVALCLRNDFAFIEASLAAARLGAYSTPMNWHNSPEEAAYIFADSGAKALVIHADLFHVLEAIIPPGLAVFLVDTPGEIAAAYALAPAHLTAPRGADTWEALIARNGPRLEAAAAPPGSMIYTSGTTGRPKGVRRAPPTPAQQEGNSALRRLMFGAGENVASVITGPMYHSAPNAYALWMTAIGAKVILAPRFDPEDLLATIEREGVTHLHMVPTMFVRLLKLPESVRVRYDLRSLRFVVHAAAPCPRHVKQAMIEWWGPIINEYYGSTETSAVVFCTAAEWLAHPGTVGRAVPGAEIRVLGPDGAFLPAGEIGEVVCRLLTINDFTYHGDDEKRRQTERQGLIFVGDVGYLDADGFLYLCDRSRDMIISGGVNIYPAEIEAELHKAPGVADCAVFGVPDEEFGEQVYAVVQPVPGAALDEADLRAFLRARIAGYKVPRRIEFRADLPREDSGKIFKRKLRAPFWEQAGRSI
jgi:long-chain acyl-CoA synthetase